jgi:branched-chain amino acid aminotransferase
VAVKVYIDGVISDESAARISVFDRGFLYGDSVYEVLRTAGGKPVELLPHLSRLVRSAASLALNLPPERLIRDAVAETLAAAGNADSYLRIIVTRGAGEVGLDIALADRPCLIVIVRPLALPAAELYQGGVAVHIVGVLRNQRRAIDPAVKSGNYLNNILGLMEARRAGAYECLMCDNAGRVAEGSTSNIFCAQGGKLRTPNLEIGLLAGITRDRVMKLAAGAGIAVGEATLFPDDVRGADEAFITSSIRGILPVARVDGEPLAQPAPGPITGRLMDLYQSFLDQVAAGA